MSEQKQIQGVDRTTKVFFYLCTVTCVSFFVWASVAPLDIVSDALGEVIPSSRVKRIQHLEGGIVREIKVREGDNVKEGQPLIELEATASDSTVEELNIRVLSLKSEIARMEAEARWFDDSNGDPDGQARADKQGFGLAVDPFTVQVVFPEDLAEEAPDLITQAQGLYETRRERFVNDMNSQREKIKQREQDIQEISVRIKNQRQSLEYVREQIKISEGLLEEKLTSRYKHLGFLKEESKLVSKIQEDSAALARSRSELVAATEKLEQISNTFHEEVQEGLRKSRRELLEFTQRLRKMSDNLQRTVIRSPADGIVKSIYIRGAEKLSNPA